MSYDDICTRLPGLSRQQLSDLKGKINGLLQFASDGGEVHDETETAVLTAICSVMQRRTGAPVALPRLRNSGGIGALREKLPSLRTFIESTGLRKRAERQVFLAIAFDLLANDLGESGRMTVGPELLMAHVHRIPAVLDKQFPGYAKAGMLGWLVHTQVRGGGG